MRCGAAPATAFMNRVLQSIRDGTAKRKIAENEAQAATTAPTPQEAVRQLPASQAPMVKAMVLMDLTRKGGSTAEVPADPLAVAKESTEPKPGLSVTAKAGIGVGVVALLGTGWYLFSPRRVADVRGLRRSPGRRTATGARGLACPPGTSPRRTAQKVADWRAAEAARRTKGTGTLKLGDGVNNHPFARGRASERWKAHPIHKERAKSPFDVGMLTGFVGPSGMFTAPPPVKSGEPGYEHYAAAQEQKARVNHLQAQLQALGISRRENVGAAVGHFDADTERRVKAYQQRKLRPVTGKVNGPMWKALAHDVDKGIKAGTIWGGRSLADLTALQRPHMDIAVREEMQALLALTPAQLNALPATWSLYSRHSRRRLGLVEDDPPRKCDLDRILEPGPAVGPTWGPPIDWLAIYGPGKTPPRNQQEFEQAVEKRGLTDAPPLPRGTPGGPPSVPATPKDNRLLMGVGVVALLGTGWYLMRRD